MIEENDCSDKEKRRRLMESLKVPALKTVKTVRATIPNLSPKECLEALKSVFGCAESGDDLYFSFCLMQQQPDIEDVRKHLQNLLQVGIIKESCSPYASPTVVVRKKNGTVRMCIDYRLLNNRTVPDQYTTPCIEDALNALSGSKWFSVLDLQSGYYQIAMAEEDKEKTVFICPLGFYQMERMPQGIMGAPATFQRLMEKAVGDMNLLQVLVYLDDLIVRPLTELSKGYAPTQKGKKHKIRTKYPQKTYILHVDASLKGLGAVLYQEYPEGLRPVAYASRKLKPSERNYPIHQLEFLSLKWAVVDKLHDYLYGAKCTVHTDNNPLTYVLMTAKLNAVGHRWLAALSTYDFDVQCQPGKHNIDADLLSRNILGNGKP
ncbi:hypothetical protein MHYP_G00007950 [Metynnis hypsauchen]